MRREKKENVLIFNLISSIMTIRITVYMDMVSSEGQGKGKGRLRVNKG